MRTRTKLKVTPTAVTVMKAASLSMEAEAIITLEDLEEEDRCSQKTTG
jgi:hypothetical protein